AFTKTTHIQVDLFGSLALTGIGHGTDRAILLGLSGHSPDTVDPSQIESILGQIRQSQSISLGGTLTIPFHEPTDLLFHRNQMYPDPNHPTHPNGITFTAYH